MPATQHLELLAVLAAYGVDFVVVGGTAAVLHGAPYTTFDVDVVYARTADNIDRLLAKIHGSCPSGSPGMEERASLLKRNGIRRVG